MEAGALGQRVGEGFRKRGQGVDVQRGVELIHAAADPPGEGHFFLHAQLSGKIPQLLAFLAVPGNDQPQPGAGLVSLGKAADQGGHILDGIQTAAMPTTTLFSSTSSPRFRRYASRSP